ncbi:MAG: GXWXG domain-containing protein [Pseudomonadota bacterium]
MLDAPAHAMIPEKLTTEEAIALFDRLTPAAAEDMIGRWRGAAVNTAHPMDGLLEASYWYGKAFRDADDVDPLIHKAPLWGEMRLNPALLPVRLVTHLPLRDPLLSLSFPLLAPLFRTGRSRARLRVIDFRGRPHAAMLYDNKPINDVFARLGPDEMLGWMDFKGMERPYFFRLIRETSRR